MKDKSTINICEEEEGECTGFSGIILYTIPYSVYTFILLPIALSFLHLRGEI